LFQVNANAKEELEILMSNFTFEYRGISRELYEAPIITFNQKGEPLFRHLRTYMESAHQRANRPLSVDQVRALDALDATLSMSQFQLLHRLKTGQILIANDSQILHDRRCFVDDKFASTLDELKSGTNQFATLKRTLLRTWVRKI
jgi:transcription initiation factor IIE alpha subunit